MVFSRSSDPALLLKHPAIQQPQPVASSTSPSFHSQHKTSPNRVVSSKGMSATDAYGGHVPSSESPTPHAAPVSKVQAQGSSVPKLGFPTPRTPRSVGVVGVNGAEARYPHPLPPPSPDIPDDEDEVETETETETDGGSTTDDEPTIRPDGGSVCSSVRSRRDSLASSGWGDEDGDDREMEVVDSEREGEASPVLRGPGGHGQEDGERTPDTFGGNGGAVNGHVHHGRDGDHAMGSP